MKSYVRLLGALPVTLLTLLMFSCSQTQATDPVSETKALINAINQGKAEAASNCFAADGELITAFGQPQGSAKLLSFFKVTVIPLKTRIEIKGLIADGENVTGTFSMTNNDTGNNSATSPSDRIVLMKLSGIVHGGKIKTMTWGN